MTNGPPGLRAVCAPATTPASLARTCSRGNSRVWPLARMVGSTASAGPDPVRPSRSATISGCRTSSSGRSRSRRRCARALSYTAFRRIGGDRVAQWAASSPVARPPRLPHAPQEHVHRDPHGPRRSRRYPAPIAMKDEPYDDFCLWLSILAHGHVAHGLDEDLARYRVRWRFGVEPAVALGRRGHGTSIANVERLSLPRAAWCLGHWGARAWLKRREF